MTALSGWPLDEPESSDGGSEGGPEGLPSGGPAGEAEEPPLALGPEDGPEGLPLSLGLGVSPPEAWPVGF